MNKLNKLLGICFFLITMFGSPMAVSYVLTTAPSGFFSFILFSALLIIVLGLLKISFVLINENAIE